MTAYCVFLSVSKSSFCARIPVYCVNALQQILLFWCNRINTRPQSENDARKSAWSQKHISATYPEIHEYRLLHDQAPSRTGYLSLSLFIIPASRTLNFIIDFGMNIKRYQFIHLSSVFWLFPRTWRLLHPSRRWLFFFGFHFARQSQHPHQPCHPGYRSEPNPNQPLAVDVCIPRTGQVANNK